MPWRGSPVDPPIRQLPFDSSAFAKVAEIMPPARLATHIESLAKAVEELACATAEDEPQLLEAAAHKIVSQAGMVGLQRLSDRAARLEQACRDGEGIELALEAFRRTAGDVHLIGEATPEPAARRFS